MGPAEKEVKQMHVDVLKKIASGVILTRSEARIVACAMATSESTFESFAACGMDLDSTIGIELRVRRDAKLEEWTETFFKLMGWLPFCYVVANTIVCVA